MSDTRRIDPERLAALIDGRLDAADAAIVRQQLASADVDVLAAFADAVSITGVPAVASPSRGLAAARPARSTARAARWIAGGVGIAAVLAAVLVWRPRSAGDAYLPAELVGAMSPAVRSAGGPAWSATRGSADGLPARGRATRIGALLIDLEVDVARGDSIRDHAYEAAALLDGAVGGTLVANELRALADSGARASRGRLTVIGRRALEVVDAPSATAGAYVEATRLAAASGDTSFLNRPRPEAVAVVERDSATSGVARAGFAALDSLRRMRPRDLAALGAAAAALLRALGQ